MSTVGAWLREFCHDRIRFGHCVKSVTATVRQVDATAQVAIDLPTHKVAIHSELPAEAFKAALAEEGYEAA
jgi:copper chaperone